MDLEREEPFQKAVDGGHPLARRGRRWPASAEESDFEEQHMASTPVPRPWLSPALSVLLRLRRVSLFPSYPLLLLMPAGSWVF